MVPKPVAAVLDRRRLIVGAGSMLLLAPRPAAATPEAMRALIETFTGGREVRPGRVRLDLPPLIDNGNSVPMTVAVDSAMTATDFVRTIRVFNQKNPQPDVITCHLGPRSGRATVMTRIKLADTQTITAIAELSDGSLWSATADVIVTIAACIEGVQ